MVHSSRRARLGRAVNDALRRILEADFRQLRRRVEREFPAGSSGSILDLACGTGLMRSMLPDRPYTGSDVNAASVALARRRTRDPSDRWVVADAQALPFQDLEFDECLCHALFHHLDDSDSGRALEELARVVKGRCVIIDLVRDRMPLYRRVLYALDEGSWIRQSSDLRALVEASFEITKEEFFVSGVNLKVIYVATPRR